MKKINLLLAAAAFAGFATSANAQATATASADAGARILAPITIVNVNESQLYFGELVTSAAAGTMTVPASGTASAAGGVTHLDGGAFQQPSVANFDVSGEPLETYVLVLGTDVDNSTTGTQITLSNGTDEMTATLSHNSDNTLSAGGTDSFSVGGVLTVGAMQPSGNYSGEFDATVSYQ